MKDDPRDGASEIVTRSGIVARSNTDPPMATATWFWWMLGLITFLGVTLRVAYHDHKIHHVDEQIAQAVVQNLNFPNQWDTNWAKSGVGGGFCYNQYNFSSYHYLLFFWENLLSLFGDDGMNYPGRWRMLNGLFGSVFIVVLALAGRQSVGQIAGIAAAAAGAVMPLLVEDAHYVRCEAMLTSGVAAIIWLAARDPGNNRWIPFSSGLIAGWMVACKATMALALPLLLLLYINARWRGKMTRRSLILFSAAIGLGIAFGVVAGMPWGVAQPRVYLSGLARLAEYYRSPVPPFTALDMRPSFGAAIAYMNGTMGWSFWAVTALGLVGMGQISGWWRTALLLMPLIAAFVVFGSYAFFVERSYSPFLPIAAVFFGAGCQLIVAAVIKLSPSLKNFQLVLTILALALTLALPAIYVRQIVFQVFSGREQIAKDAALSRMKGNLEGKVVRMFNVSYHADNYRMIEAAMGNDEAVLVVIADYYDAISPMCLTTLQVKYSAQILGVRESIFPGLPPCFLNTIMSPRLWLLYIAPKPRGTKIGESALLRSLDELQGNALVAASLEQVGKRAEREEYDVISPEARRGGACPEDERGDAARFRRRLGRC